MPDSTGCCGPGPFRAGRITAVVAPGSGHAVGEVCTLVGGTATSLAASVKILRIDNTGGVDTAPNSAYVYIGGTYSAPSSGTITMSETACSSGGSGATYDVEFGAPAFIDTQGAVQVVAYNSLAGGHQIVNFLGRSGVNSVTYIAQITEQGIHGYAGLKLEGSNTYPTTASSTILDEDSGVARLTSVGINASNNGVVAVNTTRSDGSNPLTILASTAGGTIVLPSGAIQARGLNDLAAASTVVLDEVSAGLARLSSFGPNASTNGQFELISERSDGSNPLTVISTSVVGDVIINTGSLQLGVVTTVGALGTCASGNKGYTKVVTDAAATPVYNATVAAGGSTVLAAFCNGTNWVNH
jgi:hypothetical protein